MPWSPETFLRATPANPEMTAGYTYRGLGLHIETPPSTKGRRPPTWVLTHLNSGHMVARIKGFVMKAFPIATAIAECGDWDFHGLNGWRNQDPELPKRVAAIINDNAKIATIPTTPGNSKPEMAAEISALREGVTS